MSFRTLPSAPLPLAAAALLLLVATAAGFAQTAADCRASIDLGRGPVGFNVPADYDPLRPTPLIVLLHPFNSSGALHAQYMGIEQQSELKGFIVAYPDGTRNSRGERFWNATDACCDIFGSGVDDATYLRTLVEAFEAQCNIDPRRIYFGGLSNGGFMSHRMACEHTDKVAAIASLAGTTFDRGPACRPSEPVYVLQIHGTADDIIFYNGGRIFGLPKYPGARRTARLLARRNQCSLMPETDPRNVNLDAAVPGPETTIERYERRCRPGGSVELWTLDGSGHVPAINARFRNDWVDYLLERRKPGECRDTETVARTLCRPNGLGVVHLKGGEARARFTVTVDDSRTQSGILKPNGRARVAFPGLEPGEHEFKVRWDCGARETVVEICP